MNKNPEEIELEETRAKLEEQKKFYPPLTPTVVLRKEHGQLNPVTISSPLEHKLVAEYMARSFQQEAIILFGKPGMDLPIDIFGDEIFEAWLFTEKYGFHSPTSYISPNKAIEKLQEEEAGLFDVIGACLFFFDQNNIRLNERQAKVSQWIARFAWVNPAHRGKSTLERYKPIIAAQSYGNFWIEGPVSKAMEKFMKKNSIRKTRILKPMTN